MSVAEQIREQIARELPRYAELWWHAAQRMDIPDPDVDEYAMARLVELARLTRGLTGLYNLPMSAMCAACIEAVLTQVLCGNTLYTAHLHRALARGCYSLYRSIETRGCPDKPVNGVKRELFEIAQQLRQETRKTILLESFDRGAIFPVRREGDANPPRMYGFDLERVSWEDLNVYILEYFWPDILERGADAESLLVFLDRTGCVFDAQICRQQSETTPYHTEIMLRFVFASQLERDFVEAVTRLPATHIHSVDIALVRSYKPSWTGAAKTGSGQRALRSDDLDELIAAYDQAMTEMFRQAREERHAPEPGDECQD